MTRIVSNNFASCGLLIYQAGDNTTILNNTFDTTIGAYSIQQAAGTRGLWTGNVVDKPILSSIATPGNFSGVCVKNNPGYVTRNRGSTGSIPAYTNIAHGLVGIPKYQLGITCNSSGVTSFPQIAALDATNFQLYWTGTVNVQWNWEAACPCDF